MQAGSVGRMPATACSIRLPDVTNCSDQRLSVRRTARC